VRDLDLDCHSSNHAEASRRGDGVFSSRLKKSSNGNVAGCAGEDVPTKTLMSPTVPVKT
jgi:hypothetical protein